jgi:hypothetical protein
LVAVPLCVFAVPEAGAAVPFCDEAAFCVLRADVAAGFAVVAGFAAGVELSVAADPVAAGGAVEGFVAEDCRARATPAQRRDAANTHIAMLGSFRMDLVSQRFGACANERNRQGLSGCPDCHPRGADGAGGGRIEHANA